MISINTVNTIPSTELVRMGPVASQCPKFTVILELVFNKQIKLKLSPKH